MAASPTPAMPVAAIERGRVQCAEGEGGDCESQEFHGIPKEHDCIRALDPEVLRKDESTRG